MHINVHTHTHMMKSEKKRLAEGGGMRENIIFIYQAIHHQSARGTLS
jgi:hypothetical protein